MIFQPIYPILFIFLPFSILLISTVGRMITGLNVYYLYENIGIICNALDVRGNVDCCTILNRHDEIINQSWVDILTQNPYLSYITQKNAIFSYTISSFFIEFLKKSLFSPSTVYRISTE